MKRAKKLSVGLITLLFSGLLILPTTSVLAQNPQSGAIDVGGVVPGTPPPTAANITNPTNGQRFTQANITVSGNCPVTTIVEIYKNNIFAGSTTCNGSGLFSLQIDLVVGENKLLARVHDSLNQYGPDSSVVTVYYDKVTISGSKKVTAAPGSALETIPQLLIVTDALYQGQSNARPLKLNIKLVGGLKPYAVNVDWGDGNQSLVSKETGEEFTLEHLYKEAGVYQITINASDSVANNAYLQIIGIVSGPIYEESGATATPSSLKSLIDKIFPIGLLILLAITTFWLGERWEYHELEKDHRLKQRHPE